MHLLISGLEEVSESCAHVCQLVHLAIDQMRCDDEWYSVVWWLVC